MLANLNA